MKAAEKEIYFHVGLGKTATTYLQYEFFPKLSGVRYIQRTQYKNFDKIAESELSDKLFVSREFDQQLEREVKQFAPKYPDAKVIVIFRRHDAWIASQYRRFVKNGFGGSFTDFYDAQANAGYWKHEDLDYMAKIKTIEKYFNKKPLVLFYEDLRAYPYQFFNAFAQLMDASYDKDSISLTATHTSYKENQLKVMRYVGSKILRQRPRWSKVRFIRWLQRRSRLLVCYLFLYPSMLLPKKFFNNSDPLIEPEELERVRIRFAMDWQAVHQYAQENNWQDHSGIVDEDVKSLGNLNRVRA